MLRSSVLASGVLLAIGLNLPAQVGPDTGGHEGNTPAPQPSSTLLIRLRSTRIAFEQVDDFATERKTRKIRDRWRASKILRGHYLRQQKQFDKARTQSLASFEKVAKKAQKNLLGKQDTALATTATCSVATVAPAWANIRRCGPRCLAAEIWALRQ